MMGVAGLDDAVSEIESIQDKIESLEDATKEDINELAKELRDVWKEVQRTIKISSGRLVNARIGRIVVRSKQLEARLELVLERAENAGLDTSELETLIDEFNSKLEFLEEVSEEDVEEELEEEEEEEEEEETGDDDEDET